MILKRALLFYLSSSLFLMAGHQDSVHYFFHTSGTRHENEADHLSKVQLQQEVHASCWIEDFLQHKSHQTPLFLSHFSLIQPPSLNLLFCQQHQSRLKTFNYLAKLARGPPQILKT